MQRFVMTALLASALGTGAALAAPLSATSQTQPQPQPGLGGGFIESLFGGRPMAPPDPYAGRYQSARG